jgi:hypothetical protein
MPAPMFTEHHNKIVLAISYFVFIVLIIAVLTVFLAV